MSRLCLVFVLVGVAMALGEDTSTAASKPSTTPATPSAPSTPPTPSTPSTPSPDKPNNLLTGLAKAAYDIPKGFFDACSDFKKAVFGGFF